MIGKPQVGYFYLLESERQGRKTFVISAKFDRGRVPNRKSRRMDFS